MKTPIITGITLICAIFLVSCQTAATTTQPVSLFPGEELIPFATNTLTPTVTSTPLDAPTATPAPTMTPTPIVHTIKVNETLWEIAANYNLTTDQLLAVNPNVNARLLSPGMTIVIPVSASGIVATQNANVSVDYELSVSNVDCTPSQSGGLYCFGEILNDQELMAGNITAEFQLTNPQTGEALTQSALVPLTRIITGGKLPVFTYFSPPVMNALDVKLQIQTVMSVGQNGSLTPIQTASIKVDQPVINISANGLSATLNGEALLEAAEGVSGKVWIAAVAYDEQDAVVGIRRFVSTDAMKPGESVPISLILYSIGGKIVRIELFGEVNP